MKIFLFALAVFFTFIFSAIAYQGVKMQIHSLSDSQKYELFELTDNLEVQPVKKGKEIIIPFASFSKPGFAAIRAYANGKCGQIIAKSNILPPGSNKNVKITMPIKIFSGQTYCASLQRDNGNKIFDNENIDKTVAVNNKKLTRKFYVK